MARGAAAATSLDTLVASLDALRTLLLTPRQSIDCAALALRLREVSAMLGEVPTVAAESTIGAS